ncbi:VP4 [Warrego virus]|uniref:Core protein VP4 n=1 Tax=Warrego virus TaxID=40062 RepID=A0A097I4H0_9REOV|nr:VP4 [Warrego virus]AIT55716.1 VP4 [Warrego virus]
MPEPRAVLYVTQDLEHLLSDVFLPVWKLNGTETLNDLWLANGKYATDVYAYGVIQWLSYRQMRGHNFILISSKRKIKLSDAIVNADIMITSETVQSGNSKVFETELGHKRIKLRQRFGNILRQYALMSATYLNGCEAESLNVSDPKQHICYGLPEKPPHYDNNYVIDYTIDGATDEKLVSMLDFYIYSADEVFYIGSGDLRTMLSFKKRSPTRFNRIVWYCFDPITPNVSLPNVYTFREIVTSKEQLLRHCKGNNVERCLIWDVSCDRGGLDDSEWEKQRMNEDRLGEEIARDLSSVFAYALIKHRIPQFCERYLCYSSYLFAQPGAPRDMYELRNFIKLKGFIHVERIHLREPWIRRIEVKQAVTLVENCHGRDKGRVLKKRMYEFLHIIPYDGLYSEGTPRADLFYLTNRRNQGAMNAISRIISTSEIATLWVGRRVLVDYDDFTYDRNSAMLKFSTERTRVLDGNGAVLFLIWRYPDVFKKGLSYDPSWAMNFMVAIAEPVPDPPIPDISLCRFLGLRTDSSMLRLNSPNVHKVPDILKNMGLDLSGHLYITLVSNFHLTDMRWWFQMIIYWSSKDKAGKLSDLRKSKGEVIEWKTEMEEKPWHVRNDLIAALSEYKKVSEHVLQIEEWIQYLRTL